MSETGLGFRKVRFSRADFNLELDFTVNKGELVSIIGPSGSGKSSILSLIGGFVRPQSGNIEINGTDVTSIAPEGRKEGFVFSDYALFPKLDVEQNISYPMRREKLSKTDLKAEIRRLLELVGLSGFEKRSVSELSPMERYKTALARAIASKPEIMLLDEPFSGIDSKECIRLRTELRDIQRKLGVTMVYVTHDQELALSISDRVIVLNEGHIEQMGGPEEIYRKPATEFTATFTGQCNILPYDVILRTLRVPETERSKVIYQCFGPEHRLFFRPEDMVVNDMPGLPFPEFYPHLRFENAKILRSEYLGKEYLVTAQYDEFIIKAYTVYKPASDFITAGIRMTKILEFNNGKLTRH